MIESAKEFIRLRDSELKEEYDRSAFEEASLATWLEIIDSYPQYARWVAHNKTVPLEVLEKLSEFDVRVREAVASKRKLSVELFEKLSRDESDLVRCAVAANAKAPICILNMLLLDVDADVASVARYNIENRKG